MVVHPLFLSILPFMPALMSRDPDTCLREVLSHPFPSGPAFEWGCYLSHPTSLTAEGKHKQKQKHSVSSFFSPPPLQGKWKQLEEQVEVTLGGREVLGSNCNKTLFCKESGE